MHIVTNLEKDGKEKVTKFVYFGSNWHVARIQAVSYLCISVRSISKY